MDDGLRSGLVTIEELCEVALFARHHAAVGGAVPRSCPARRMIHEIVRRMINEVVTDLIEETGAAHSPSAKPATIDAVRALPGPLVGFSEAGDAEHLELKKFLRTRLYRHERIEAARIGAGQVLREPVRGLHAGRRADAGGAPRCRARAGSRVRAWPAAPARSPTTSPA